MDSRNEEKNKEDEVLVLESENVGEEVLDTTCTEKPKRDYENENQNDQVDLMEVHGSESSEGHLFDDVENIVVLKEAGKSAPGSDAAHEDEINAVSELFNLDTNLTSSNPNLKEDYYGKTEGTEAFAEDTLGQRSETSEPQVPTLQKELVTESCLSPKDAGEFKGEEDELTKEEEKKRHEELMEQYKLSIGEQKAARELNLQLQTKLAEYFRRKKVDTSDPLNSTSSTGGSATDVSIDYEQRFARYISSLADLHHQYDEMKTSYSKQIEELKILSEKRQQEVNEAYKEFMNFKYSIGKEAVHSQTGKPINPKELTAIFEAEKNKEAMLREVRLENIKLKNEVSKVETLLKSKEELAGGLHLIDFEQLKIENQTYNEKIEERNEELSKLRRKISNMVQITTHIREKLQAVQNDNINQRKKLDEADVELTLNRDKLTKMKQTRELLRAENARLRRSCGLLGKNTLLLNYEDSYDSVLHRRQSLNETKLITANYQLQTKSLAQKIRDFKNNKTGL